MIPINVLYGSLTGDKTSADSPVEIVSWAASGDTRGPGSRRKEIQPARREPHVCPPPATVAQEVKRINVAGFLKIWGLVSLKDK